MSTELSELLKHLKSLYPTHIGQSVITNPWYIVAAVAFCSSNRPEHIPAVFKYVLDDLDKAHAASQTDPAEIQEDKLLLARKIRESLFKAGLISGYNRAINGLASLHEVMPRELQDKQRLRNPTTTMEEYEKRGATIFAEMYGDTAESVQTLMDSIHPDMGWFSNTIGYGITYGYTSITSALETSIALVSALIASDTPRQIQWHTRNTVRLGATREEVAAVRAISMEACAYCGVAWRNGVPEAD